MTLIRAVLLLAAWVSLPAFGADTVGAVHRTNGQNYKDRALAVCVAAAYHGSPAGEDASTTKSIFVEWTYYDEDNGDPATDRLVQQFLKRDYSTPVEGYVGARFDLLKCLDLYHSKELEAQVKKFVPHPDWIGDQRPSKKKR